MLWVDKHCPRQLDELLCHGELNASLQRLARAPGGPGHLLVYGPSGSGRKTRIRALLRALFGPGVDSLKSEVLTDRAGNATTLCGSVFHHQIQVAEMGTRDRVVIQQLFCSLAQQGTALKFFAAGGGSAAGGAAAAGGGSAATGNASATSGNVGTSAPAFRVFVFVNAELLSPEAQDSVRRTLETSMSAVRIILECENLSAIKAPLRSRCVHVRVPAPSDDEVLRCLRRVLELERVSLPDAHLAALVGAARGNLRRALLGLEVAVVTKSPPPTDVWTQPWERLCVRIVDEVLKNRGMRSILECREMLYELLTSQLAPLLILETLCDIFMQRVSAKPSQQKLVADAAAHYSYTLTQGSKAIWHLEAFLAQLIAHLRLA